MSDKKFDNWLSGNEVSGLVMKEKLVSMEGKGEPVFPATYSDIGYNIDGVGKDSRCAIDSIQSQANRIEPMFKEDKYRNLVPQVTVKAGEKVVNLLDIGHRTADASVRFSELEKEINEAFVALSKGDASKMAKIAPTSLIFGAWDSRAESSQVRTQRLIVAKIDAFDVMKLTRSATYLPPVDYGKEGIIPNMKKEKNEKTGKNSDVFSENGMRNALNSGSLGGIVVRGDIVRSIALQLPALRMLGGSLTLQRYLLGLSLVAFTYPAGKYLRQGCNLVNETAPVIEVVYADGRREQVKLSHEDVLKYAQDAAKEFGVGANRDVLFEKEKMAKVVKKKSKDEKEQESAEQ